MSHFNCDCPECLMDQIPQPPVGFGSDAINSLRADTEDSKVKAICEGCPEQGDCCYDGMRSARVMCRVVKKASGA